MTEFWRIFNDPARYEAERATRLMPDQLFEKQLYTLRIRWPEEAGGKEFGREFAALLLTRTRDGERWAIAVSWKARGEAEIADMLLSDEGFVIAETPGEEPYEMGYFVGSTDPWDVELANLTQQRPLVPA